MYKKFFKFKKNVEIFTKHFSKLLEIGNIAQNLQYFSKIGRKLGKHKKNDSIYFEILIVLNIFKILQMLIKIAEKRSKIDKNMHKIASNALKISKIWKLHKMWEKTSNFNEFK